MSSSVGASLREVLASGTPSVSFEFMPPRSDDAERSLWRAIRELEPIGPTFVSVTYGAGGSTRDRTVRTTARIATDTTMRPVGHLTAVAHSVSEIRHVLGQYADAGVWDILALRGDPPGDPLGEWTAHPEGLEYAVELVELIRAHGDFCVGVAAFPEKHPRSPDRTSDVAHLLRKIRAGADFVITNMCFVAEHYLRLRDEIAAAGCDVPILPGIMPVTNVSQIEKFAALSGAELPSDLVERLHAVADDPAAVREVGIDHATGMCRELLDAGAPGLHLYTLNRSTAALEIVRAMGLAGVRA
jgi:methylenetetrahydrofolate reductase (NADPH)